MKKLHTNFEVISKIEKHFKLQLTLEEERLLTIVISYRKEKDGCYYSNAQLSEWLRCKERKAGNVKASLLKKGLITSTTRKGQSSILKLSNKVSMLCQPVSIIKHTGLAPNARNTSSKEEEGTTNNTSSHSFRNDKLWKEGLQRAKTITNDPKKQIIEADKYYKFKQTLITEYNI